MADYHVNERELASGAKRWKLQWRLDGRQGSRTFTERAAAEHWEKIFETVGVRNGVRLLNEAEAGEYEDDVKTVEWVVREFVRVRSGITPGTRGKYLREAELHIFPSLGALPVTALSEDMVSVWVNELEADGLAAKTIKNRHGLLSTALTWAVKNGHAAKNVARGIDLPEGIKGETTFLEAWEVAQLLAVLKTVDERYVDLVTVLVGTGMRWGECTALEVRDVVENASGGATLKVTKAWKEVHTGQPVVGPPKTKRGVRTIPLPPGHPALQALRRQIAQRSGSRDLIFQSPTGKLVRNGEFHDRVWSPLRRKLAAEFGWHKSPRIHDLRHTAASLMLGAGADIQAVSAILGHEKVSTTMDIYGHLLGGAREAASAALGAALGAAVPPPRRPVMAD